MPKKEGDGWQVNYSWDYCPKCNKKGWYKDPFESRGMVYWYYRCKYCRHDSKTNDGLKTKNNDKRK